MHKIKHVATRVMKNDVLSSAVSQKSSWLVSLPDATHSLLMDRLFADASDWQCLRQGTIGPMKISLYRPVRCDKHSNIPHIVKFILTCTCASGVAKLSCTFRFLKLSSTEPHAVPGPLMNYLKLANEIQFIVVLDSMAKGSPAGGVLGVL